MLLVSESQPALHSTEGFMRSCSFPSLLIRGELFAAASHLWRQLELGELAVLLQRCTAAIPRQRATPTAAPHMPSASVAAARPPKSCCPSPPLR